MFSERENRSLGMSFRSIFRVVSEFRDTSKVDDDRYSAAADAGEIVKIMLEESKLKSKALKIRDVHEYFVEISASEGKGSKREKEKLLRRLISGVDALEAKYVVKNMLGEMRHGASEGVMLDGISEAAGVSAELVHRAYMFMGDLGEVATTALGGGKKALLEVTPTLFRPMKPMLAQPTGSVQDAWLAFDGRMAVEYKYDGARVQIHKKGGEVRVYSRSLTDITARLPETVAEVEGLRKRRIVVEGEVIGLDSKGRPLPFQHIMRRITRVHDVGRTMERVPLRLCLFDCLMIGEELLVDLPYEERWSILAAAVPGRLLARRLIPESAAAAYTFFQNSLKEGHEGLMAKELSSTYTPGARRGNWLKIKLASTVDLVILAAEWGYGRRHGWLSNYRLAVLDEESGAYAPVGKTYKGLRDEEFQALTKRLLSIQTGEEGNTVYVEPRVVVEVAFNEIQRSSHYSSGMALRFARVARIRSDKSPDKITTLKALRSLYRKESARKGRIPDK